MITGTPTRQGTWYFYIDGSSTGAGSGPQAYKLTVLDGDHAGIELENGIKYVPYSCCAEKNFTYDPSDPEWAGLYYELVGTLPSGLNLDRDTAVISGVPMASGTWSFTVKRCLPHDDGTESVLALPWTLTVQDNTDAAVKRPNDYIITDPVGTPDPNDANHFYKTDYVEETLVIDGPYADFYRLRIDGVELYEPQDYTSREGSTVITLRDQTFRRFGEGTHTISAEYRAGRNPSSPLQRVSQNYTLTISRPSGGGSTGGSSGSGRGSGSGRPVASDTRKPGNPKPQTPPPGSSLPFLDVSPSDWFYEDLVWAYENEIMFGYPDNTFRPQTQVSQATIVTVLSRLARVDLSQFEGETEPGIPTGQTFTAAAVWAKRAGLLPEEGAFTGSEATSRNQMAVMLVKYLLSMGQDTTPPAQPVLFTDAADMSREGNDAFQVLYQQNIFRGTGGMNMNAAGATTRAHFAALVHRIYEAAISG